MIINPIIPIWLMAIICIILIILIIYDNRIKNKQEKINIVNYLKKNLINIILETP